MIKIIKSNKFTIFIILLICFIFALNPAVYSKSCLNALSVWGFNVFPVLFPFFIFTRVIVSLSENKPNFMDKFFNKFYNCPYSGFQTFFLSILSGYPMGAKLISNLFEDKKIDSSTAKKMFSFCSVSGPMFMLGTVGISIFSSFKCGLVILVSNILASLINGLFYRGKKAKLNYINSNTPPTKNQENLIGNCVSDALSSILMVGAYIILSFLIIDMFKNLHFFDFFANVLNRIFKIDKNIFNATLCGIFEITRGCIEINSTSLNLCFKTVIASTLIGFGGISTFLQSLHFISKVNLKTSTILLQKFTQGLLCLAISLPFSILFL